LTAEKTDENLHEENLKDKNQMRNPVVDGG